MKEAGVSWNLKGSYFETCSCDLMCPCNMSMAHGATYDFCRVTLVFNIKDGEIEGTDVSGLGVAAIADSPKVMTEGNWRLGLFIDDRADDEQMETLTAVYGGQKGGPMELDFEIEDIVPFGVETGQPVRLVGVFHPAASEFNAAEAKRSKINAFGIEYEGKTGISASEFAWAA